MYFGLRDVEKRTILTLSVIVIIAMILSAILLRNPSSKETQKLTCENVIGASVPEDNNYTWTVEPVQIGEDPITESWFMGTENCVEVEVVDISVPATVFYETIVQFPSESEAHRGFMNLKNFLSTWEVNHTGMPVGLVDSSGITGADGELHFKGPDTGHIIVIRIKNVFFIMSLQLWPKELGVLHTQEIVNRLSG